MIERHRRDLLITLLALLSLLLTACFRDTSEVIQEQPVARQVASPTPAEERAKSRAATATEKPDATAPEADQFALTATALIASQTQPAAVEGGSTGDQGAAGSALQATAIPLARATIPPGEDCVHEIRAGDTLYQLSLAYGLTVMTLRKRARR